jgi:hypothetical protein
MRWMGLMRNALKERLRVAGFSAHSWNAKETEQHQRRMTT